MKHYWTGTAFFLLMTLGVACNKPAPTPSNEVPSIEQALLKEADSTASHNLAVAKAQQKKVVDLATSISTLADNALAVAQAWPGKVDALLTSEDGKFIAGSPEILKQFSSVVESKERPEPEVLESIKSQLDTLSAPIKTDLSDPTNLAVPPANLTEEVAKLKVEVDTFSEAYVKFNRMLDALIGDAKTKGSKSDLTLKEALASYQNDRALNDAELLAKATSAAHSKGMEDIANAAADKVRSEDADKASDIRIQANLTAAETEKKRLEALADNPDTIRRLAPFLTKAPTRLHGIAAGLGYSPIKYPAPVSFSAINKLGGLETNEKGLRRLYEMTAVKDSGRPSWSQPTTEADWQVIRENQKLLIELGPTLVELGKLEK